MTAKSRYDRLSSDRSQFLNSARQAADLTLPYLIREDEHFTKGALKLTTPWQSTGAKGVVTLASKLMLALLPPQTSFFKLQVNDINLPEELGPEIRSELDLSFAKVERTIMESIAASTDRVVVHQALKHLVVAGNALIFMGKDGLKLYPLNRYVVDRDGNGNVIEIVTKETISKKILKKNYPDYKEATPNDVSDSTTAQNDECDIYTHCTLDNNRWVWHQEVYDQILTKSMGKAPVDSNPWLVLRFNHVDGEVYGRGRVEEFLGDLKSLEALSQAIVEGSAAAAKVVFTVSPSSTTKPSTLAKAGNGAIIQGRPDDIGVVQVGKTADFQTAYQMIGSLTQRLSEAFLIMNVRDSERTTAEEVRMTQLELEQQLGGLFSLLTVEFLVPYLNRKLSVAQKTGEIPRLPKGDIVKPTIVAGINALGRGQDRESLGQFLQIIAQTIGPEAIGQFINTDEVIKRLAAASGIDVLNLVKSMEEQQSEQQQAMEQQQMMAAQQQEPQMAAVEQKREQAEMQAMQQQQAQQQPPQ
ncbi:portal protein [bacterium]|nr:portal protein [bacterium]